jgi:hypothetical protein
MKNMLIRKVIAGTAATINVELGFTPDYVVVKNCDTRTVHEYDALDTINAYGIAVAAAGTRTQAASAAAGLAAYAGSVGTGADDAKSKGITIGASATVNQDEDVLIVEAGVFQ